jgi:hypothetical protein
MGWLQGFQLREGERAHENNMLDIQTKVERHKAFTDHLLKISEDPTYLPEAQQAAHRRLLEARQVGPLKFKNYDMSDILTVKKPALTSVPQAPKVDAAGSLGGMSRGDYGPSEIGGVDPMKRSFVSPTGEDVSRPGKWSIAEQAQMDEDTARSKASMKTTTDPVEAKVQVMGSDLGVSQINGQPVSPDDVYMKIRHRSGAISFEGPIAVRSVSGGMGKNAQGEWVPMRVDPFNRESTPNESPEGVRYAPPSTRAVIQPGENDIFYSAGVDPLGEVISRTPTLPPRSAVGTTTNSERLVNTGRDIIRQDVTSSSRPNFNMQGTIAAAQGGSPANQLTPQQAPAPMGTPQRPPSMSAASTPPPPTGAPSALITPSSPIVDRNTQANLKNVKGVGKPVVIKEYTPIDKKNVGASLRPDFEPTRTALPAVEKSGSKFNRRMESIPKDAAPLTRYQKDRMQKDANIRRQVIDRLVGVFNRAHMLDNMLVAGKLQLAVDPKLSYKLITRVLGKLSPEESQLASDFVALKEDIQNMRGPMGAAGFRSLEAFMALQDQRGSLMGDVNLTRNILRNSMRVFLALQGADLRTIREDDREQNLADPITVNYYNIAYGNEAPERGGRAMRLDGYHGLDTR